MTSQLNIFTSNALIHVMLQQAEVQSDPNTGSNNSNNNNFFLNCLRFTLTGFKLNHWRYFYTYIFAQILVSDMTRSLSLGPLSQAELHDLTATVPT